MVIKDRLTQWRKDLFDSIGKYCGAVLAKFLEDFRRDALDVMRSAADEFTTKADETVDKLTDAIPGTLDDRLFDGRFGQLLASLEKLLPILGGGGR